MLQLRKVSDLGTSLYMYIEEGFQILLKTTLKFWKEIDLDKLKSKGDMLRVSKYKQVVHPFKEKNTNVNKLRRIVMFRKEIVGNQEIYSNYSIYSSSSAYNLRYQNCQLSKAQDYHRIEKILKLIASFLLFVKFLKNHFSKFKLIASTSSFGYKYWTLCCFVIGHNMSLKPSTAISQSEAHRAYQVVEIMKNDILDEPQSSDGSNKTEPVTSKTKKSLFAALIKREHRSPKMKITKKIEACSTVNFVHESASSEQKLTRYEYSTEMIQAPVSKALCQSNKTRSNIFKRIIRRSDDSVKKSVDKCCSDSNCDKKAVKSLTLSTFVPTAYIPKYNYKLINAINELQNILHNLHHSEQHMIYLLKKYVEDQKVLNQLLQAASQYFALQYDSKNQTNILAEKIWLQQLEASKAQDHDLQKRLNLLVKTNRSLESQIEALSRQCEKLASRTNLYPKRFLHMRSFGKVYARQLIDNNRKLQKKVHALNDVLSDFEEELQRVQHQKQGLEEEKRSFRERIYYLEGVLEKEKTDHEVEKSAIMLQINHQNNLISDAAAETQFILRDFHDLEFQLREFAIKVTWPNLQFENACLPEMVHHIRACIRELFLTMITTYRNMAMIAKDVTKLRNTNTRLQENLQKSTYELDNLSKKMEKNSDLDLKILESNCQKLEKESLSLRMKLESANEVISQLRQEMEVKRRTLSETQISAKDLLTQNQTLIGQIDELVQVTSQMQHGDQEFNSNQEKLDYLRLRFDQIISDQMHLAERCSNVDEENQLLAQTQEAYQQDLVALQDGITLLGADNDNLKKQLMIEHQTVTSLQNERLKYLEEKNILKTIFQHLKGEVTRIQQLEGAVADMSKETNRLTLIAEFNKQLGEQLKDEVEVKETTILELRQSLEKLSHLQLDNDKEKMTLCAQLSEVATVKEKLSDCLEIELRKNMRLDESKKKLESATKSQLKIYEEMQKNERAALKELLKDFKGLIKQRDCLVQLQEENKKKCKEVEKRYLDMKKLYEGVVAQSEEKDAEMKRVVEKFRDQEEQIRQQDEKYNSVVARYEKSVRKLERLIGQIRNEKGEAETSTTYLKTNIQKLQNNLNEVRERVSMADNKLAMKTAECATLEAELNTYKNELQGLNQEHGKAVLEIEYLRKWHEQQTAELKNTISNFSNKDSMFLETQTAVVDKDYKISELKRNVAEKEGEIKSLEQECGFLKRQCDDQNRIIIGYENHLVLLQDAEASKLKIEKELSNLQLEHRATLAELEKYKNENEIIKSEVKALIVKNETEKKFYHSQANEIILQYSEEKVNIEEEIDNISNQLRAVTENLHTEKYRFDELARAHEELKMKYIQMKESQNSEVTAHKETLKKIDSMDNFMKNMATERDNLQKQVQMLLVEIGDEKNVNRRLIVENRKIEGILEQGKQQYSSLKTKNSSLEEELKGLKLELQTILNSKDASQGEIDKVVMRLEEKSCELKSAKETIDSLKKELTESQKTLIDLKEELFKLQQQVTGLEFKNCELTLQLHESQGKLETEINLYKELHMIKNEEQTQLPPSEGGETFYLRSTDI